ncbi:tannase and feruloyl esterase [Coniochaeta sp. PMI_546]|nr:tannase and feruloyl esterase [Coniochaeta sp. PMI_546]
MRHSAITQLLVAGTLAHKTCKPICEGISLATIHDSGFSIASVKGASVADFNSVPGFNFCNLTVEVTHTGVADLEIISIWLPSIDKWNGRFLALGGGGLATTDGPSFSIDPTSQGYATGYTEGGLTLNGTINPQIGAWVLANNTNHGEYNLELLKNFVSRAIHDLSLVGRAAVRAYYGNVPSRSYYSGCSAGGFQGYVSAQGYAGDFDGILANAPVQFLPQVAMATTWPPLLMEEAGVAPPMCVFDAFQAAIVSTCDEVDGAKDGLIVDPTKCRFDPTTMIGSTVACTAPSEDITITATHADIVSKVLEGPQSQDGRILWYGLNPGASFAAQAATAPGADNKTLVPAPFIAAQGFVSSFVERDPAYKILDLTVAEFDTKVQQTVAELTPLMSFKHPELTAFKEGGHKLLTWHGTADEILPYSSTVTYRSQLAENMGGDEELDEFSRLFFAPGVGHCQGGVGPFPVDALAVLVKWVEEGIEPNTLFAQTTNAEGQNVTRNLCPWPRVLRYKGSGDVNAASSFECILQGNEKGKQVLLSTRLQFAG